MQFIISLFVSLIAAGALIVFMRWFEAMLLRNSAEARANAAKGRLRIARVIVKVGAVVVFFTVFYITMTSK